MPEISPEIYIDGIRTDFIAGTLDRQGQTTAGILSFTIPGDDVSFRKFWGKEITFFLNKDDTYPMFRGYVINTQINENVSVRIRATDALGFLTGLNRARVTLDDSNNIDGCSIGSALKKMINMAGLTNIGTDFLGDTDPVAQIERTRGSVFILDTINENLNKVLNTTNTDLPRQNFLGVKDDGLKSQLFFAVEADIDNAVPVKNYNYDNIISFSVQNREIPTIITVQGENVNATYKHTSAMTAFGEHFLNVDNNELTSKAACYNFAQQLFIANLRTKYEYKLETFDGVYLEENDVIFIDDKETEVRGTFRIIGKQVSFGVGEYSISLTINKQPPLISQFLA
jgi:hypothetical protein